MADLAEAVRQVTTPGNLTRMRASGPEERFAVNQHRVIKALREAARVLKSGGILFVSEPLAEGAYFETMKPVHDETKVRRQAQDALRFGPEFGLLLEKALTYIDTVKMLDFEAFHDRLTMINPQCQCSRSCRAIARPSSPGRPRSSSTTSGGSVCSSAISGAPACSSLTR